MALTLQKQSLLAMRINSESNKIKQTIKISEQPSNNKKQMMLFYPSFPS